LTKLQTKLSWLRFYGSRCINILHASVTLLINTLFCDIAVTEMFDTRATSVFICELNTERYITEVM